MPAPRRSPGDVRPGVLLPGAAQVEAARSGGPGAAPPVAPALPRLPAPSTPPVPPVVLLHGFVDNRSAFVLLRRALARDGTAGSSHSTTRR